MLDCPLRDAPFSLDTPLIDILLSRSAQDVVNSEFPGVLDLLPKEMFRAEPPTFAAIMTLRNLLEGRRNAAESMEALADRLGKIAVTDEDRRLRCARYDADEPDVTIPDRDINVLIFDKINGFDHGESVEAAAKAVESLASARGWGVSRANSGGAFTKAFLASFDAVVWNNVSGDVLTLSQREAFERYMRNGGGFVGLHGSAGDSVYFWDWYADTLIGARFIGHPMQPQFQDAMLRVERHPVGIGADLEAGWTMTDEWYSFQSGVRDSGATVVATLDEASYEPGEFGGRDLRMGEDHPIIWTRCVGSGRVFYSAVGHLPGVYQDSRYMTLLGDGLAWAATGDQAVCESAVEHAQVVGKE